VKATIGNDSLSNLLRNNIGEIGIRSLGFQSMVFKPLNHKHFLLAQTQFEVNGNYAIPKNNNLQYVRFSMLLVWGLKVHDRLMWGAGISRNFRTGELGYFPVLLFNYTSANRKWGIESLLPARGHFRFTINPRNLLFAGFELEGTSYTLLTNQTQWIPRIELRKSELRFRVIYERSIKGFLWASLQAGYRYNYAFKFDAPAGNGDFYRGFGSNRPYFIESSITGAFYAQLNLHLVSP
jgi:hypothetical protein